MKCIHNSHETLALSNGPLPYLLRRSARRHTLSMRVAASGGVVVNAPLRVAAGDIERFMHRHLDWLHLRRQEACTVAFHWQDGVSLPCLGMALHLRLLPHTGRAQVWREGDVLVCTATLEAVEAAVTAWYRKTARTCLTERLCAQAAHAGRPMPPLRLSNARTRWGSLSPTGVISLNWRLIKAPVEVIDYVICHELAHFRQRNHSAAFWREVALLCPDWQVLRRRLKEAGREYFLF